jgi:hypothetical protein
MGRPKSPDALIPIEIGLTAKTLKYIDMLMEKDGFGFSRPEVVRYCIWQVLHKLIEVKRLPEDIE